MHSIQPPMMSLALFLVQYYSALALNAKMRLIFKMGYRKWHFLLLKCKKIKNFHKINILEKTLIYKILEYESI